MFCVQVDGLCINLCVVCCLPQSEKDSKEEILKAFRLFDDDSTVSCGAQNRWLYLESHRAFC